MGFVTVVFASGEPACIWEPVVEVLGVGRAREMGWDFGLDLGLDGRFGSSVVMLVPSSLSATPPLTSSLSLAFAARPTKLSESASFSEPDCFNDLRGRFRAERVMRVEACERAGEGLDLRTEVVTTVRDGNACGSWSRIPRQFSLRHDVSLSLCMVESALNRARLTSVFEAQSQTGGDVGND